MKSKALFKAQQAPKPNTHYTPSTPTEHKMKPAAKEEWKPSEYSKSLFDSCFKNWS